MTGVDDDLRDTLDRLEGRFGNMNLPELTNRQRERLDALFRDPEDLNDDEREHLDNIKTWLEEEGEQDIDRPDQHELTPAEMAALELFMASESSPPVFPASYWDRFPDAPPVTDGGHRQQNGVRYGGLTGR